MLLRQPTKTLGTPRLFPKAAPTNGFSHKISARNEDTMTLRKPVFTVLSLLVALVFALGSRPFLIHSFDQQLADANLNSAAAIEDSGRMAGFALIAGQVILGGIGAAVGTVLVGIGFWRRERWRALRWCSLLLNLVAVGFVGATFIPSWLSQHRRAENYVPNTSWVATADKLPRSLRSMSPAPPCHHI